MSLEKKKLLYIACIARPDTKDICRMKYWIRAIALNYRFTRKKKKKICCKKRLVEGLYLPVIEIKSGEVYYEVTVIDLFTDWTHIIL